MRWLWVCSRMRAGHQKEQAIIRSLEFSAPTPTLLRREEVWKWSKLMSMPAPWNPHENRKRMGFIELLDGSQVGLLGGWCTWRGHWSSVHRPHVLPYTSLPSGCSSVSFDISFYNKPINTIKLFPWILWADLASLSNPRRGSWEPLIYIGSKHRRQWTCDWRLKWRGASLVGLSP